MGVVDRGPGAPAPLGLGVGVAVERTVPLLAAAHGLAEARVGVDATDHPELGGRLLAFLLDAVARMRVVDARPGAPLPFGLGVVVALERPEAALRSAVRHAVELRVRVDAADDPELRHACHSPHTSLTNTSKHSVRRRARKRRLTDIARRVYLRHFTWRGRERADGRETGRLRAHLRALPGADCA